MIYRPENSRLPYNRALQYEVVTESRKNMIYVSSSNGVCVDHKDRIWIVTYRRQPEYIQTGRFSSEIKPGTFEIEYQIFSKDGVWQASIPMFPHIDNGWMRISGKYLYLKKDTILYEYEIIG